MLRKNMNINSIISSNKKVSQLADHIFQLYKQFQKDHLARLHGWPHVGRVLNNISVILGKLSTDISITPLLSAAFVHDIGYFTQPEDHVRRSAYECEKILPRYGFSMEEVQLCKTIVLSHSPSVRQPRSMEDHILFVADKCDLIGYDGTLRSIMEHSALYNDRDILAKSLMREARQLVEQLRRAPIGHDLIEERWLETQNFFSSVLSRVPSFEKD